MQADGHVQWFVFAMHRGVLLPCSAEFATESKRTRIGTAPHTAEACRVRGQDSAAPDTATGPGAGFC